MRFWIRILLVKREKDMNLGNILEGKFVGLVIDMICGRKERGKR